MPTRPGRTGSPSDAALVKGSLKCGRESYGVSTRLASQAEPIVKRDRASLNTQLSRYDVKFAPSGRKFNAANGLR